MPKVLLGKNIIDRPVYWEIEKEKNPHLLVLGTSGCGKTETLNAIIHDLNSILGRNLESFDFEGCEN
jgi:DNA segregation ATPase FtsK/SpoIIIE-like protein